MHDTDTTAASRDAAIARIVRSHPDLQGFESRALPPSEIQAKPAPHGGWLVGFVSHGSGRPGILAARCFAVDADGRVSLVGALAVPLNQIVSQIDLATCRPLAGRSDPPPLPRA